MHVGQLANDVSTTRIHPAADIAGASCLSGPKTSVGPGAVVRDSRLHNIVVAAGAVIIDSIIVAAPAAYFALALFSHFASDV